MPRQVTTSTDGRFVRRTAAVALAFYSVLTAAIVVLSPDRGSLAPLWSMLTVVALTAAVTYLAGAWLGRGPMEQDSVDEPQLVPSTPSA